MDRRVITATPGPTATAIPTRTPAPSATPRPTATARPSATARPTADPAVQQATQAAFQTSQAEREAARAFPCRPGQVKGNRNSGIYHTSIGADYAETQENVQCLDTAAEAEAAGFRASRR